MRIEFHEELEGLRADLIRLGAMVSETVGRGTAALLDRDLHAAQELIDGDDVIDDFCLGLEERCCQLLALQAPIAGDLRFVLTTLRLISELERSADLVVNICKASRRIYDVQFDPQIRGLIEQMGVEATFLIRTAIDSYVDADTSLASALDDIDDRLDELQVAYVQQIFRSHSTEGLNLQGAVQLAMIGRYYERIGDHAVNIGQRVMYMVTGWLPEHTGSARHRLRDGTSGGATAGSTAAGAGGSAAGGDRPAPAGEPRTATPEDPGAPDPAEGPDPDTP